MNRRFQALEETIKPSGKTPYEKIRKQHEPFNVKRPAQAVNWLMSEHRRRSLTPALDYIAYLRGARKFLDTYGSNAEYLLKMFEDNVLTEHPFTFKFVIEQCAKWDDGERKEVYVSLNIF